MDDSLSGDLIWAEQSQHENGLLINVKINVEHRLIQCCPQIYLSADLYEAEHWYNNHGGTLHTFFKLCPLTEFEKKCVKYCYVKWYRKNLIVNVDVETITGLSHFISIWGNSVNI